MPALSATARHEYYVEIANALPWPVVDTPENRERRLTAAVEAFNDLQPVGSYEGRLAVQVILAGAHAAEAYYVANNTADEMKAARCRALGGSLSRESRAARRTLLQEQKLRVAVADVAARTAAAEANSTATPAAKPEAAPPFPAFANDPAATPPEPAFTPMSVLPPRPAMPAEAVPPAAAPEDPSPPSPEAIARAEAFMRKNIVVAAQIRHDGGITPENRAYFFNLKLPDDPALVDALVRGRSENLLILDEVGGEALEAAA